VPYSATGNAWPNPQLVTLSFVPDGTVVASDSYGHPITSNLFATFNAHPGWTTATWQDQIIKAAQAWAQQTNLNFQVVADSGADSGAGSYQQGDPQFGDIRVGGYAMTGSNLAYAYLPPPVNNFSVAGDFNFNTSYGFNVGSTYDLFTVAAHETGHALGMDHSTVSAAVMYPGYTTVKSSLNSDDVAGIRSIYSAGLPRSGDAYSGGSGNHSFANAVDLTSQLEPVALTTVQNNLDITSAGEADYYKVTAPATTGGTLVVKAQTAGLSLLRQAVTVYASNQSTVLGSASSAGAYNGTTDTVTVSGVTAGQVFYLKVAGADTTAFGTGAYALTLNLGSGASPAVTLPNTLTANGSPFQAGGGEGGDAPPLPASVAGDVTVVPDVGFDLMQAPAPPDQGGPEGRGQHPAEQGGSHAREWAAAEQALDALFADETLLGGLTEQARHGPG
jgi:hypothetical protein